MILLFGSEGTLSDTEFEFHEVDKASFSGPINETPLVHERLVVSVERESGFFSFIFEDMFPFLP